MIFWVLQEQQVYWVDSWEASISRVSYASTSSSSSPRQREVLLQGAPLHHPAAVALYNRTLYWLDTYVPSSLTLIIIPVSRRCLNFKAFFYINNIQFRKTVGLCPKLITLTLRSPKTLISLAKKFYKSYEFE